jgi:hypothetical protein
MDLLSGKVNDALDRSLPADLRENPLVQKWACALAPRYLEVADVLTKTDVLNVARRQSMVDATRKTESFSRADEYLPGEYAQLSRAWMGVVVVLAASGAGKSRFCRKMTLPDETLFDGFGFFDGDSILGYLGAYPGFKIDGEPFYRIDGFNELVQELTCMTISAFATMLGSFGVILWNCNPRFLVPYLPPDKLGIVQIDAAQHQRNLLRRKELWPNTKAPLTWEAASKNRSALDRISTAFELPVAFSFEEMALFIMETRLAFIQSSEITGSTPFSPYIEVIRGAYRWSPDGEVFPQRNPLLGMFKDALCWSSKMDQRSERMD